MRKIRLLLAALLMMFACSSEIFSQNTIVARFRDAQQNYREVENIRFFTFRFNDEGRLVEYRIEDQLGNRQRKPRRIVSFQDQDNHILYTRLEYSQDELTNEKQWVIRRRQDGYEIIQSADPGGTPDLFYTRTGEKNFTQIYKGMEIYSIDFSRDHLSAQPISNTNAAIIRFIYEREKLDRVMYDERKYAEVDYQEDYIHIISPSLDMGDRNMYIYIGDDYVPPADNMIRAFNEFLMPGEYRGFFLPFLVGYF